jgi:exosortase/archaeosortase family protein
MSVIGLIGMFGMSILRIYLLMVVGTKDEKLALTLFHSNIGWIMFVAYLLVFWYLCYPYVIKDHKK